MAYDSGRRGNVLSSFYKYTSLLHTKHIHLINLLNFIDFQILNKIIQIFRILYLFSKGKSHLWTSILCKLKLFYLFLSTFNWASYIPQATTSFFNHKSLFKIKCKWLSILIRKWLSDVGNETIFVEISISEHNGCESAMTAPTLAMDLWTIHSDNIHTGIPPEVKDYIKY